MIDVRGRFKSIRVNQRDGSLIDTGQSRDRPLIDPLIGLDLLIDLINYFTILPMVSTFFPPLYS